MSTAIDLNYDVASIDTERLADIQRGIDTVRDTFPDTMVYTDAGIAEKVSPDTLEQIGRGEIDMDALKTAADSVATEVNRELDAQGSVSQIDSIQALNAMEAMDSASQTGSEYIGYHAESDSFFAHTEPEFGDANMMSANQLETAMINGMEASAEAAPAHELGADLSADMVAEHAMELEPAH